MEQYRGSAIASPLMFHPPAEGKAIGEMQMRWFRLQLLRKRDWKFVIVI